jgi:hypothetical protein
MLLAAVACGPTALLLNVSTAAPSPTVTAPAGVSGAVPEAQRGLAAETAANAVVAWLTTPASQVEQVQQLFPGVQDVRLPQTPAPVGRVSVLNAVPHANGLWQVTVTADVATVTSGKADSPESAQGPVRRYWLVPIAVSPDGRSAAAAALPADVPAPKAAEAPELGYAIEVAPSAPLAITVKGFLAALVTGQTEEATRFAAPGFEVRAIDPPAASSVQLSSVQVRRVDAAVAEDGADGLLPAGQPVRLRARVLLGGAGTAQDRSGEYFLTAAVRDGRWEITGLDEVPQLLDEPAAMQTSSSGVSPGALLSPPQTTAGTPGGATTPSTTH